VDAGSLLNFLNSAFVSSVFGGLVAGGLTYFGVMISIRNEKSRLQTIQDAEIEGFCQAIGTELDAIRNRYISAVGEELGKSSADEPFMFYYPVFEDYFTVFNSNAKMLGKVNDAGLRTEIVQVYTKAKSILDSIRHNNHLLIQYQNFFFRASHSKHAYDEEQRDLYLFQLKQYAPALLRMHSEFMVSTDAVIGALKKSNRGLNSRIDSDLL
jgi:hypothetical protein